MPKRRPERRHGVQRHGMGGRHIGQIGGPSGSRIAVRVR